jgi:hypothetical protein
MVSDPRRITWIHSTVLLTVVSTVGLGTKNHSAGEGQQQFTSSSQPEVVIPVLSSQKRSHSKHVKVFRRIIWSWVPTGLEIKNYYAGEDQ